MRGLLGVANVLSIGAPYRLSAMLLRMSTLPERLRRIREAAGYGGERQAAEFARRIGIKPPSLHALESGDSKSLGRSLPGYISIGANPNYILHGKGPLMLKDIEKSLRAQTLVSMMLELEEKELDTVEDIVKAYIRAKPGGSGNDPYKKDPPKAA